MLLWKLGFGNPTHFRHTWLECNHTKVMIVLLKANNSEYYYSKSQCQEGKMATIFGDVLCYTHRASDFNSGTQLNNFKELFWMFYFDLRYEQDRITEDPQLIAFNHALINTEGAWCSLLPSINHTPRIKNRREQGRRPSDCAHVNKYK